VIHLITTKHMIYSLGSRTLVCRCHGVNLGPLWDAHECIPVEWLTEWAQLCDRVVAKPLPRRRKGGAK
jgi:hypothetical protein